MDHQDSQNHELLEPQPWGDFAGTQDKYVGLMTPPLEVLRAAYDSDEPAEIAYVMVLPGEKRLKKKDRIAPSYLRNDPKIPVSVIKENKRQRHYARSVCGVSMVSGYTMRTSASRKPKYRLLIDGEAVEEEEQALGPPPMTIQVKSKKKKTPKTPTKKIRNEVSWDQTEATETDMSMDSPSSVDRAVVFHEDAPRFTPTKPIVEDAEVSHCSCATPKENVESKEAEESKQSSTPPFLSVTLRPVPKKQLSPKETNELKEIFSSMKNRDMGDLLEKLVETERKENMLHKQLTQSGMAIAEDIPYEVAKAKIEAIALRMNEIGGNDVTHPDKNEQARLREEYFKLEQDMEKYNAALVLTDEYQAEQEALEKKWEDDHAEENRKALLALRRHMPVDVRKLTSDELVALDSPNGKHLPVAMVKKFKRTNVLQLLRVCPDDIERMHPSTLEMLRVTGLTLTERRALYVHLKDVGRKWKSKKEDKMIERKWQWFNMMKMNFKENLGSYDRHVEMYGPPGDHPMKSTDCPGGCPMIGKQCPLKADTQMDYSDDYGFTEADQYEGSNILNKGGSSGSSESEAGDNDRETEREHEAEKDRLASSRLNELKNHYGKLLQVSKANGSCETMDELVNCIDGSLRKWVEQFVAADFEHRRMIQGFSECLNTIKLATNGLAQRAGVKTSGALQSSAEDDIRSSLEAELSEEVYDRVVELFNFIEDRMPKLTGSDNRVFSTISMLDPLWEEIHVRNEDLLKRMGVTEPRRTKEFVSVEHLEDVAKSDFVSRRLVSETKEPADTETEKPSGRTTTPPLRKVSPSSSSSSVLERAPAGLLEAIAAKGKAIEEQEAKTESATKPASKNKSESKPKTSPAPKAKGGFFGGLFGKKTADPLADDDGHRSALMSAIKARESE